MSILPPLLMAVIVLGCANEGDESERSGHTSRAAAVTLQMVAIDAGCGSDSVRPSTGAPAEGLWGYADAATSHRVAARIGPAGSAPGATRVTRTVETLEVRPGSDTIRHVSDTASVQLQFVPPSGRAAAVYPIGRLVQLAAYEPCRGRQEPLIRYLRKDRAGRVTTDVLLHREARP